MNIFAAVKSIRRKETFVWVRRRVDPLTTALAWKAYDSGFREANRLTPCRQSFHRDEFWQIMLDKDFDKIFLYIDGKPVGLAIMTLVLGKLPWINQEYFEEKFPDKIVAYVPTIVVSEEFRGDQRSGILMEKLYEIYGAWHCDLLAMDHSVGVNSFLPYLILRYFKGRVISRGKLDDQSLVRSK